VGVCRDLKRKKEQEARQKRGQHSMCSAVRHGWHEHPLFRCYLDAPTGAIVTNFLVPHRQCQATLNLQDIPLARDHLIEHRAHDTAQE
jgi:hypothetical protein